MSCGVLYIIEKLLKLRCLKWARIAHLNIWSTSYGQKKGQESNCQFDSRPEKVGNRPNLLSFRRRATYLWKALKLSTRATTLLQTSPRSEVCSQSYGAPKSRESPLARFRDSHLGVPGKKNHLDVGPVERSRVYYKGGRWWLPPSPGHGESCVFVLPMAHPSTKGAPTMHQPLYVGCVQARVSE
jgi:hypothetical protein